MLPPVPPAQPEPQWERFFDEQAQHHFWYNASTGESRWEDEVPPVAVQPPAARPHVPLHWLEHEQDSSSEEDELSPDRLPLPPSVASTPAGQSDLAAQDRERPQPGARVRAAFSRAAHEKVVADTACIMCCFKCCFMFHACLCEAPAGVLEGGLRAGVHAVGAMAMAVTAAMVRVSESPPASPSDTEPEFEDVPVSTTCFHHAQAWARESVLDCAATLSFLVPCSTWFIYKDFRADEDDSWSLRPLPTVAGWVDPRRFAVVTWGQGSDASNVLVSDAPDAAPQERPMDTWPGPVLHAPANVWTSWCEDPKNVKFKPVPTDHDSDEREPGELELTHLGGALHQEDGALHAGDGRRRLSNVSI